MNEQQIRERLEALDEASLDALQTSAGDTSHAIENDDLDSAAGELATVLAFLGVCSE